MHRSIVIDNYNIIAWREINFRPDRSIVLITPSDGDGVYTCSVCDDDLKKINGSTS